MAKKKFKRIVQDYQGEEIRATSPTSLLQRWIHEAHKAGHPEANAFVLSTSDTTSRVVLLKALRGRTITFFTNYRSNKGRALTKSSKVALNFYWGELHRQVRITGRASKSADQVSDRYFASRPRSAQLAVHTALQSEEIPSRAELLRRYTEVTKLFDGEPIPRPLNWGGYDVKIESIEFWQGMPSRLHDRVLFSFSDKGWKRRRLAP